MREVLIDTDILSYYFRGDKTVTNRFSLYLDYYDSFNISMITYFEVLSGLLMNDARAQLRKFEAFCSSNNVINISEASVTLSAKIAAHLQRKGSVLDNQDVLIAGIALEHNLVLITNNEKHFSRIPDLQIDNWKKI
ncbi:MAG: type II toxin-antitoxin system VapC family toxin [Cyclobacteriaceae bacterium]|nr:type II toxin-antitoxin system VapC family toxin [Cyclobacteriaceae bacterium]